MKPGSAWAEIQWQLLYLIKKIKPKVFLGCPPRVATVELWLGTAGRVPRDAEHQSMQRWVGSEGFLQGMVLGDVSSASRWQRKASVKSLQGEKHVRQTERWGFRVKTRFINDA